MGSHLESYKLYVDLLGQFEQWVVSEKVYQIVYSQ